MKKYLLIFMSLALTSMVLLSCEQPGQENDSHSTNLTDQVNTESLEDATFENYLSKFENSKEISAWPKQIIDPIYNSNDFYSSDENRDQFLKKQYTSIDPRYSRFIPISKIKNLAPKWSRDIESPYKEYDFWALKKSNNSDYWLLSILAIKRNRIDEEFHAYPLIVASYSLEGKILDHFVWTYFEDDTEQIWDEIAVSGDTLIRGYKSTYDNPHLDKIYTKTIVTPEGKFKTVSTRKL